MGAHLIDDSFQSDKYPTTPRGKVPLSVSDVTAQDLLYEYAQRHRIVDAEFSDDLEAALDKAGYVKSQGVAGVLMIETGSEMHLIPRNEVRHVEVSRYAVARDINGSDIKHEWSLTYTLSGGSSRSITFREDHRPEAIVQSGVTADEYNGSTARMMMGLLVRGSFDTRAVRLGDGPWEVTKAT